MTLWWTGEPVAVGRKTIANDTENATTSRNRLDFRWITEDTFMAWRDSCGSLLVLLLLDAAAAAAAEVCIIVNLVDFVEQ